METQTINAQHEPSREKLVIIGSRRSARCSSGTTSFCIFSKQFFAPLSSSSACLFALIAFGVGIGGLFLRESATGEEAPEPTLTTH